MKGQIAFVAFMATMLLVMAAHADVARDLARCEIDAERLYPAPPNKGLDNSEERIENLQRRSVNVETCMRAAGYVMTGACAETLTPEALDKHYDHCMKISKGSVSQQYDYDDWGDRNRACLKMQDSAFRIQRGKAECYQSDRWWLRWLD